jgi:hypothetical protein
MDGAARDHNMDAYHTLLSCSIICKFCMLQTHARTQASTVPQQERVYQLTTSVTSTRTVRKMALMKMATVRYVH